MSGHEGGRRRDGYWPKKNDSGVTIASGFDLGRHGDVSELRKMGFPEELSKLFGRYLGKRGKAAEKELLAHPLNITWEQLSLVDRLVATYKYNEVAKSYNEAHNNGPRFEELPSDAQTAIMDVAFNHGQNLSRSESADAKMFWTQVILGEWADAYQTLRDFAAIEEDAAQQALLDQTQTGWETYVEQTCELVSSIWQDGSYRVPAGLRCELELTQQRIRDLNRLFGRTMGLD